MTHFSDSFFLLKDSLNVDINAYHLPLLQEQSELLNLLQNKNSHLVHPQGLEPLIPSKEQTHPFND